MMASAVVQLVQNFIKSYTNSQGGNVTIWTHRTVLVDDTKHVCMP